MFEKYLQFVQTTQGSKPPFVWITSTKVAGSLVRMLAANSGISST